MKLQNKNRKSKIPNVLIAAMFLLVFAGAAWLGASFASNAFASTPATPVILVHGYNNRPGNCQGIDLASYWKKSKIVLTERAGIPANDVVPVSYYRCDNHGVDITGYGPGTSYPFTMTTGTIKPRAGHTNKDSITLISKDLAWFVYNEYTLKGRPVNLVGHSMGGLVAREALRRVQAQDPSFPPSINVDKVLTISTPHNGWGTQCKSNTECVEMSDGSQFLAALQTNDAPQGVNGTSWWAMGTAGAGTGNGYLGSTCDFIPTNSAIAVGGIDLVYTKPCYKHNAYLTDDSSALDAIGSNELGGRHSLAMMVQILTQPN